MRASKINRWFLLALVLLVALVGCRSVPATTTPAVSGVNVSISMVNPNVKSGDAFTVDVVINSNVILRGAQCALSFDPVLMQCDRVVEGNFFKDWAADNDSSTIMVPQPVIDNKKGYVSDIGIAIMGTKEGGVKGSGVVCTYYFTAQADGVAKPTLSNVLLSDENGKVFPATGGSK